MNTKRNHFTTLFQNIQFNITHTTITNATLAQYIFTVYLQCLQCFQSMKNIVKLQDIISFNWNYWSSKMVALYTIPKQTLHSTSAKFKHVLKHHTVCKVLKNMSVLYSGLVYKENTGVVSVSDITEGLLGTCCSLLLSRSPRPEGKR